MQLCTFDRAFRDLVVNPVATALMRYMIGPYTTRFSSHNCFVEWKGEGYGESLGLHCDQGGVPQPWGRVALNANCNWYLTDCTFADDCGNPKLFKQLAGFGNPYHTQVLPVPKAVSS